MADRGRTCRTPTAQLRTADCTDAAPRIELRTAEVVVYIGRIATAAERAVAGRAVANGRLRAPRFSDVLAAAEADEPWALDLLRDRARAVGRAAALLLDVINPQMLVVREAGTARRPELLADLRAEVARHTHRGGDVAATVVAGSFGVQALGVAAGSVVLRETYERPLELPARI